ncbi:MAG: hypothetical protein FJ244_10140 [Nitrospira sp.]|nr:hypothetical protein [Nitrospira sp.]
MMRSPREKITQEWHGFDTFHLRFESVDAVPPGGFLLTKFGNLSVMTAHMAMRGTEPSPSDITQVVAASTMLVRALIFGDIPVFAANNYLVREQGAKTVKPVVVRVDGTADRSTVWPNVP